MREETLRRISELLELFEFVFSQYLFSKILKTELFTLADYDLYWCRHMLGFYIIIYYRCYCRHNIC